MDIDRALERAMEADDPGPAFAGRVIAAITGDAGRGAAGHRVDADRPRRRLARAAAARGDRRPHRRRRAVAGARAEDARARAAHEQLLQALRLTGEKLNVVHRAIERSQE